MAESSSNLRLVVRGLPWESTEEDLCKYFTIEAPATQLVLPKWTDSGRCKGTAFITFNSESEVEKAKEFNGQVFTAAAAPDNGREIKIAEYIERRNNDRRSNNYRGDRDNNRGDPARENNRGNYRGNNRGRRQNSDRQYQQEQSEQSGSTPEGPNNNSESAGYESRGNDSQGNESRGRGRGRGRGSRRERPARDEESVQYETTDESDREVYVSNVPFDCNKEDFERNFGSCGTIEAITIPEVYTTGRPKGFAFVRFETVEGRAKALELNGSVMHDRTIGVRENKGRAKRDAPTREKKPPRTRQTKKPDNCTTIYVGNLPWETDEKDLEGLFTTCGKIASARIVRQSWTKRSRGFGYVEFDDTEGVDKAMELKLEPLESKNGPRELRVDYAENLEPAT